MFLLIKAAADQVDLRSLTQVLPSVTSCCLLVAGGGAAEAAGGAAAAGRSGAAQALGIRMQIYISTTQM